MSERPLILLAGGGSGGHLFPALAVAEVLQARAPEVEIRLLVTDRRIDREVVGSAGLDYQVQPVRPASLRPWRWPGFWRAWRRSVRLAEATMRGRRPAAVLGGGGYGAGPAVYVASRLGIPAGLLNPDAIPGRANRYLARRVRVVFVQWAQTSRCFSGVRVEASGCPVRGAFACADRREAIASFGLDASRRTLLVTGASQGARTINQAVGRLLGELAGRGEWQVLHVSGWGDYEWVRAAYRRHRVAGIVVPFTRRMAGAMAAADLVVSRAGASTLAEVTCVGRASVLLPYPFGRDGHQEANARILAEAGAAVVVADRVDSAANAAALGPVLGELMDRPERLKQMASAAKAVGRPDAAARVGQVLLELAGLDGE